METNTDFSTFSQTSPVYAGFWWRFLAYIIDDIVLDFVTLILILPFLAAFIASGPDIDWNVFLYDYEPENMEDLIDTLGPMLALIPFLIIGSVLVSWLYYALMESSRHQATIGKLLLNLRVTDLQGQPVTFGKASGRYFGKILSALIFGIGFIMAGLTRQKQALHDILADCLVIKISK